jgi:hypothetical protein
MWKNFEVTVLNKKIYNKGCSSNAPIQCLLMYSQKSFGLDLTLSEQTNNHDN